MTESTVYIDEQAELNAACEAWRRSSFIVMDTEFIRRDTFYPIAGLIQVGVQGRVYLIDPLGIDDWNSFKTLLEDPAVVKVLHSCSEDLEVFDRLCSALPSPLLDTQIGAGLAGVGEGLSYQKLVAYYLDIEVDKGETRSDWLQRPLTESQCHYAALDVEYLQRIYPMLRDRLAALGRLDWWQEDCERMIAQAKTPVLPEEYYLRNKSLWKLKGRQRLALKVLCAWREEEARRRDMPRGRIFKDPVCFELARCLPENRGELSRIKDLSPGSIRRYGDTLIGLLDEVREAPESAIPPAGERPLTSAQKADLARLRHCGDQVAEQLAMPAGLLCRRRDLEALVREGKVPDSMGIWRQSLLAGPLLAALEEK